MKKTNDKTAIKVDSKETAIVKSEKPASEEGKEVASNQKVVDEK